VTIWKGKIFLFSYLTKARGRGMFAHDPQYPRYLVQGRLSSPQPPCPSFRPVQGHPFITVVRSCGRDWSSLVPAERILTALVQCRGDTAKWWKSSPHGFPMPTSSSTGHWPIRGGPQCPPRHPLWAERRENANHSRRERVSSLLTGQKGQGSGWSAAAARKTSMPACDAAS